MTVVAARPPITAFDTTFQNPILLAAGTAGFGRELDDVIRLDRLGGIVTKAVSPEPRAGHPAPRVAEFEAGMLNAIGLANPGLDRVARDYLPWLADRLASARVIVNVVGNDVEDYVRVISRLGAFDVVTAFELNVSCPNTADGGREFGADETVLSDLVGRAAAATAKPVIVKLAPNLTDLGRAADAAAAAGARGFTLVNTMPGTLSAPSGSPRLGLGRGGVSGPALLPIGVLATQNVSARTGLPVIGVGGIRTPADVEQYLRAGATLVAVGTAALADPRVPERLVKAWERRG